MTKAQAIYDVMTHYDDAVFIASCGWTSRFAYEVAYYENKKILPLTGSMGMTASLSIGYALANPDVEVVALMGDGDYFMGFNALLNMSNLDCRNLTHVVLIDGQYESTGGQPTTKCTDFLLDMIRSPYGRVQECLEVSEIEMLNNESSLVLLYVDNDDKKAPRVPDKELPNLAKGLKQC